MKLTPNFALAEFEVSDTARQHGISNTVPSHLMAHAQQLANWLQVLRDRLSAHRGVQTPIIITSAYRSPEVNRLVGGSATSSHMTCLAADIHARGVSIDELFAFIRTSMRDHPADQVIHEFGRWVHVGLAQPNATPRKQFLYAEKQAGRTVYRHA